MNKWIHRALEELCPVPHFVIACGKKRKEAENISANDANDNDILTQQLAKINSSEIAIRLLEEHKRGSKLDEKTYKITTVISIGITIVGILTAQAIKIVDNNVIMNLLKILIQIAIIYGVAASFVSIGAVRALPQYGFGTEFVMKQKEDVFIALKALRSQEAINITRQLRNECAYLLLRNSYYLIILIYSFLFIYAIYCLFANDHPHPSAVHGTFGWWL